MVLNRILRILCLLLLLPVVARAADDVEWGTLRAKVEDHWSREESISREPPKPGIALSRADVGGSTPIIDFMMGWTSERDGGGVVGMFAREMPLDHRVEVRSFGRSGTAVRLVLVEHPSGGKVPLSARFFVRDKLHRDANDQAPVRVEDAQAVGAGGKNVIFAAPFPQDLPPGEYEATVELQNTKGTVLERLSIQLVREAKDEPLKKLTDEQLIAEYVKRGEALRGTSIEPVESRFGRLAWAVPYDAPPGVAWQATSKEIVRRGFQMTPLLETLLEKESARNTVAAPGPDADFGLAFDVMSLCARIRDPKMVPLLLRIIDGMDGKANARVRLQAVQTVAAVTHISFFVDRSNSPLAVVMMSDDAIENTRDAVSRWSIETTLRAISERYRNWLDGEGRDSARWVPLARERARAALKGDDAVALQNAIAFLTGGAAGPDYASDDAPEVTMRSLAARASEARLSDEVQQRLMEGLASYGPAARAYAPILISRSEATNDWSILNRLSKVGGEHSMAFLVNRLPALRADVDRAGITHDAETEDLSDPEVRSKLEAYRACRFGIERWAGRTFDDDQSIAKWWEAAKGRSQREWLEENLERTCAAADGGDAKAQYLVRADLKSLPFTTVDLPFDPPRYRRENVPYNEQPAAFSRLEWVKQNRARLRYDEAKSSFVLR